MRRHKHLATGVMTPAQAKGEATASRAGVSPPRAPALTLPGSMQLHPGQRLVDICDRCHLTFASLTEPWCPVCNGQLRTAVLTILTSSCP